MATKRLSTELEGDSAIKMEIIYTSLSLNDMSRKDADKTFCEIATLAVEKAIDDYRCATGVQYPSHTQIVEYLSDKD